MADPTLPELMQELIDALGKAEGAASQLVHSRGHPGFIMIRDCISLAKEGFTRQALSSYDRTMYLRPL